MARIRSLTARLGDAFESSPFPAYILDEQRRLVFVNAAFLLWTGLAADQAIGVRLDYQSNSASAEPQAALAGLCPPPDALAAGSRLGTNVCVVAFRATPESLSRRRAIIVSLAGTENSPSDVLVLVDAHEASAESDDLSPGTPEARDLHDRLARLRVEIGNRFRPEHLLGDSVPARRIREQVRVAVAGRARTLIVGPRGSGREHVARTIHYSVADDSPPPLLVLACPLLDREMLHSTIRSFLKRGPDPKRALAARHLRCC
jgi:hypothetical protein